MANISLSKENVKYIREAFSHFFPEDTIYSTDKPYTSGEFNWDNRKEFMGFVYRLTGVQIKSEKDFENIKKAQLAVEKLVEAEEAPKANRPTKEQLETLEEEGKKRAEAQQAAAREAKKNVEKVVETKEDLAKESLRKKTQEDAVKEQRVAVLDEVRKADAIRGALVNQKVYFKVEKNPVAATQAVESLKQQAKADPKKFIEDAAKRFRSNSNIKGVTTDELQIASEQAAVTTYDVLTDNSPVIQIALAKKIIASPKILNKLVPDIEKQTDFKNIIGLFVEQKTAQSELVEHFIDVSKIDGITIPENVTVQISETPGGGFRDFDLNQQIILPHLETLNQQGLLLENVGNFGEREIRSHILSGIGERLKDHVSKLPTDGSLPITYSSEITQSGLSSLAIVETTPWVAAESSLFGRMAISSGFGPILGRLGEKTGINFGVKKAAEKIGVEVVEKVVAPAGTKVAIGAATGTGLAAAITATFAWTGPLAPVIGTVGAFLVEMVGAKIINKIIKAAKGLLPKIKENLIAISGGMLAAGLLVFPNSVIGIALSVGGGVGIVGGIMNGGLSTLGASLSSIGSGIAAFLGALGGAFLASIGMPIIVTLLVFPVVVAFILFIINSGAYIVPPTSLTSLGSNPYIQVDKVASPAGPFKNTDLPQLITYTVTVTAKKSVLTNITFSNDCQILTSGPSNKCPSQVPTDVPASISPSSPYTFTYSERYSGSEYKDSIILDTFTVVADTQDAAKQEVSGSASVSIGTPPTACLEVNEKEWPSQYYANIVYARSVLVSKYSSYVSKVCMSYTSLPLKYNPSGLDGFWGYYHGTYIDFFPIGVTNQADALYILSHELGHALAGGSKTGYVFDAYRRFPGIKTEAPYCFYGATQSWNEGESLPESIALHIIEPRCGSVQRQWPIHYQFLMRYVFN
ncbi:MAG: hypothetical protein UV71_C0001G0093 [Microgenomates group bacterium GW2011_GWC1_43_13]|nr:MAG: hypothetical protein UV71_C0001G0093 [Microgenomates group bacterium GW2011_GWC1_43_13]